MDFTDLYLLIVVYIYVILLFIISEKFLASKPSLSRKFVHIMVGNCIFIMPFFANPYDMVWFLTLPITIAAFLMSKYSPIDIKSNVTEAGHDLGLVYYAGIWSLLIFLLPDKLWIVSLAIAAMVYGDGFASLIGQRYGKHKINLTGDEKSIEGSAGMFVITFIASLIVFIFYQFIEYSIPAINVWVILVISLIATVLELITPKGLDNISTTSTTAILYYLLMVVL